MQTLHLAPFSEPLEASAPSCLHRLKGRTRAGSHIPRNAAPMGTLQNHAPTLSPNASKPITCCSQSIPIQGNHFQKKNYILGTWQHREPETHIQPKDSGPCLSASQSLWCITHKDWYKWEKHLKHKRQLQGKPVRLNALSGSWRPAISHVPFWRQPKVLTHPYRKPSYPINEGVGNGPECLMQEGGGIFFPGTWGSCKPHGTESYM